MHPGPSRPSPPAAPTNAGAAAQAPDVDLQCLLSSCGPLAAACAADANCQAIQSCITACAGDAACNNACFFKLADDPYAKLALCAVDAGCIAGPPSLGNETCPDLSGAKLASGFNTSWLAEAGTMYVAGGGNPVYDCFDCQVGGHDGGRGAAAAAVADHWCAPLPALFAAPFLPVGRPPSPSSLPFHLRSCWSSPRRPTAAWTWCGAPR